MSDPKQRGSEALPKLAPVVADVLRLSERVGPTGFTIGDIENDPDARARLMAIAFASKQDEHLRTVRALVQIGQHRDALIIARTMAEGLAQLLWAYNHRPQGPDEWFLYGVIEDWRQHEAKRSAGETVDPADDALAQRLLGQHGPDYYSAETHRRLKEGKALQADPYRRQWNHVDVASMLNSVNGKDLYETVYRNASGLVHWSPRALLLAIDDRGKAQTYTTDDPASAAIAVTIGIQSLLQTLEVVNLHFGLGIDGDLAQIGASLTAVMRPAAP